MRDLDLYNIDEEDELGMETDTPVEPDEEEDISDFMVNDEE